jgi:hypothetical protein
VSSCFKGFVNQYPEVKITVIILSRLFFEGIAGVSFAFDEKTTQRGFRLSDYLKTLKLN